MSSRSHQSQASLKSKRKLMGINTIEVNELDDMSAEKEKSKRRARRQTTVEYIPTNSS